MQKHKRRRRGGGKTGCKPLIAAIRRLRLRRAPVQRRQRRAGAIDNRNWNKACDVAPALPAIKMAKVIGPHLPDEMHAFKAPL